MLSCEGVVDEAAFLKKTRAGGNWLTGGIVDGSSGNCFKEVGWTMMMMRW
jgi:hypothetical protein